MAELQVLLQSNGAFKSELLQAFLSASRSTGAGPSGSSTPPPDENLNVDPQFVSNNRNTNNFPQNINENTMYSSQNTNVNTNQSTNSSLILDNVDRSITSPTLTGSTLTGASPNLNVSNINAPAIDNINRNTPETETTTTTTTSSTDIFADLPSNQEFVTRVLYEVKQPSSPGKNQLTTQVTEAVVNAHMDTTINTYANVAEANERIKNQPPPEMPDMSKLSINPSAMWQQFMASMKPEIAKVVMFCKKLPGFSEISQQDQMMMIKRGTFEVMISRFCILIDHVKEEMFDPCLKMKSPRHVVKELPTGAFVDKFFDVAKVFNPLELTDGEIGLFTAILMFCPDRPGVVDTTSIATIQLLYLQSLYTLLKESHQDPDSIFSKLISLIPMFQKINDEHFKFINAMKMKTPSDYNSQFPPLHKDVFADEKTKSS